MTNRKSFERYSRQILFQPIGNEGQSILEKSRVAVVGIGALGTVIANHLTRSGIGYIRIIDRDFVELSNLQRQTLFSEEDAANHKPKVIAAYEKLSKINSSIEIDPIITDLHAFNAEELLLDVDLILDGTDNFQTRYLINDISLKHKIPWVYGGAVGSRGMTASFFHPQTPCYRCLFPIIPSGRGETCDTTGVISPITDIVGSYQVTEALKILLGHQLKPSLVQFDIWLNDYMQMDISGGRNTECPACVQENYSFLNETDNSLEEFSSLCGRNTVQISPKKDKVIDFDTLEFNLAKIGIVERNSFLLRFIIGEHTIVFFKNGRVLVQGTDDIQTAKVLYSKYIGL